MPPSKVKHAQTKAAVSCSIKGGGVTSHQSHTPRRRTISPHRKRGYHSSPKMTGRMFHQRRGECHIQPKSHTKKEDHHSLPYKRPYLRYLARCYQAGYYYGNRRWCQIVLMSQCHAQLKTVLLHVVKCYNITLSY